MAKFYFRTRGGPIHGWGNIFRLVSFAGYCRERGVQSILFFVEGPKEVQDFILKQGFSVVHLPENLSLEEEEGIVSNYPRPDVLIIEMLDCNYYLQTMLRKHTHKLIIFDDLLDHYYCADLVVCGQALPDYGNLDISAPGTDFLLGFEYFLCRPEFVPYHLKERNYADSVGNILVSLGGGRYDVGYLKIAHALKRCNEKIVPTFVLGYVNRNNLRKEIQTILPHAIIHGGVGNIEELFWNTDLAIISAGYHKLEAAITSTPALLLSVQWHQMPLAEEFSKITGIPNIGYMSFVTPENIFEHICTYQTSDRRKSLATSANSIIDGKGFERVYSAIML